MATTKKRAGYRSPKNGHLGVYTLCSGPDPNGPIPGERLIIVIYNQDDSIVRRLEQVKGNTLDDGYFNFFNSMLCRPAVDEYHIIDIDKDGNKQILATHTTPHEACLWLNVNVLKWVLQYGVTQ